MKNFSDIITPLSVDEFFEKFHDKKPLHIKAKNRQKFSHIMSWEKLNELLNMRSIWSLHSLNLVKDKQPIHPQQYCDSKINRDKQESLIPSPQKVISFLKSGASLICNDIDQLSPELSQTAHALQSSLNGKCQANLYCSWEGYQAFDSHFDTHDVYALHIEGTKTWRIYEGRVDNPIPHPLFTQLPQTYHEQHKGKVALEIHMEPGDLLYIPRGTYHDAVATSQTKAFGHGSVHIAFGVNHTLGLDMLDLMREYLLQNKFFRSPIMDFSAESIEQYFDQFLDEIKAVSQSTAFKNTVQNLQNSSLLDETYTLPINVSEKELELTSTAFSLLGHEDKPILKGPGGTVPVPAEYYSMLQWILKNKKFTQKTYESHFSKLPQKQCIKLLDDLQKMHVLKRVS